MIELRTTVAVSKCENVIPVLREIVQECNSAAKILSENLSTKTLVRVTSPSPDDAEDFTKRCERILSEPLKWNRVVFGDDEN